MSDGLWAKFLVVLTTDNQIWVRLGKRIWKFKLGTKPTRK